MSGSKSMNSTLSSIAFRLIDYLTQAYPILSGDTREVTDPNFGDFTLKKGKDGKVKVYPKGPKPKGQKPKGPKPKKDKPDSVKPADEAAAPASQ